MIHVLLGRKAYEWPRVGRTLLAEGDIMLLNYQGYDTIIVNNAHTQPNIAVFARLCSRRNIRVMVGGLVNKYTMELAGFADTFKKRL